MLHLIRSNRLHYYPILTDYTIRFYDSNTNMSSDYFVALAYKFWVKTRYNGYR